MAAPLSACAALEGPDWLVAEKRSPDGRLVARLWCEDFCDVAEASTLTISPADHPADIARDEFGTLEGELPESDAVVRVFRKDVERPLELSWSNSAALVVAGQCLSDGNYRTLPPVRAGRVTVKILDRAPPGACERAIG